jgi:cytochrome c553
MRTAYLVLFVCASGILQARASPVEDVEFFEKQVRPVLAEHCYKCHGPEKQKAELRLDSREAILKGTDLGPVLVPGSPDESSLITSIRHQGESKMPEKADKLADNDIAALTEWVRMGAPWPAHLKAAPSLQAAAAQEHWSFQPVTNPPVPDVHEPAGWAQSQIDRFVLATLDQAQVLPSQGATRRTLIRRATFDLTGLPPTLEEVESFEQDTAPDAFERLIDRLLSSPRYGERWGRYWLDVARYSDTKGYVFQEERRYPYSYTYRDWVIRAFNEDLPYDQFLIQQIAADHVADPDNSQSLAAMGFLTLGRRFLNQQPDIIDDRIDVISRGTMGLTVSCARCHDHKFDPVTQKDYYALYGVFASSTEPAELPLLGGHSDEGARTEYEKELSIRQEKVRTFIAEKSLQLSMLATVTLQVPVMLPPGPRDVIKVLLNRLDRIGRVS